MERSESRRSTAASRRREQSYFDAGLRILADGGYGNLKLEALCAEVAVTTGAFYHNFDNWGQFTDRLLQYWRAEQTTRRLEVLEAELDAPTRLRGLLATALELPHRAEAAIRVWGAIDETVALVVESVDAERLELVRATYGELLPPAEAEHYTLASLYLLVGFQLSGSFGQVDSLQRGFEVLIGSAVEHAGRASIGAAGV